ncbi:MAG: hypothetical protein COV59_02640 [Candidatus Magasanikbacteria bacterium CG11_big_fil_rev_8_21_14_0_20_39_34]|uniref:DUF5652 domain-containing protein n=1 Tax=Candidatus Magasanikbacteria bacterium CG11_big_fil_rev_8_21_14_0_20_39_34 TaxID=1974653 RepID=A0A2H0N587_9BACT|nr:MAG: hypothetical protein COV59_02640 [Candidatus Magasanikbacteria bacterium CG11_big_fil_rev_8_21_14_0_20_39_34]
MRDFPSWFFPFIPLIPVVLVWTLFWKGLALWHSGRKGNVGWFCVLLVVNTLGILEIIYLFAILKLKFSQLFHK